MTELCPLVRVVYPNIPRRKSGTERAREGEREKKGERERVGREGKRERIREGKKGWKGRGIKFSRS